jgi:BioD-like phosphotransacetylase family protein
VGVLYIVSAEEGAGKTAICAGLAINLLNAGKKVGYLKPSRRVGTEKGQADGDIDFMRKVLGLSDVVNAPDIIKGRDIVLVEAGLGQSAGDAMSKATYGAAKEMKAKAIAVEAYSGQASKFTDVYKGFGESLLGVVLNKVPQSQLKRVREEATAQFSKSGIKVLGVVPENRVLLAITVGELAECLQGKILNSAERSGELVENYMLGAMVVDSGLEYFGRKSNKAAVIRQDRPDMQLAALETPTKCLVLSGSSQPPVYNVLYKAESRGIPIITTETTVSDIVTSIENALMKTRFNQEKKLAKLAEIVKQNLDLKAIG